MHDNTIIRAFGQIEILEGYDKNQHKIIVVANGKIVGEVVPEEDGYSTMAYAYDFRGTTRGRDGVTPIGPTLKGVDAMARRIVSVMFNGDADGFKAARLVRQNRG